jgi:hypothetical protein
MGLVSLVCLAAGILGLGATAVLGSDTIAENDRTGNAAVLLLAHELGGAILTALLSCLAFVTLLAVAAGLTLAAASSLAHDLYGEVIRKGRATETEELAVARLAAAVIGILGMLLALVSWGANTATLAFLAFAIAASAILPTLVYTLFWRRFTGQGALLSLCGGLLCSVLLVVFSESRRTVPVTGVPPTTVLSLRVTLVTAGPVASGVTDSVKARLAVPCVARMIVDWLVETGKVVTVKDAVVSPCATVTEVGTLAIVLSSLLSDTVMPLPVAGAVRVTVPVALEPPVTESGETLRFDRVGLADVTVKRAVLLTPPALAVITDELVLVVVPETTVNDAASSPAGTVTLAGTVAAAVLPLVSETTTPPVGAVALRVTVPVLFDPSTTVSGFRLRPVSVGLDEAGTTVSTAERDTPPEVAVIVTWLVEVTDVVVTGKVVLVEPPATVTLAGTDAAALLLLVRATACPPAGAVADSVTLPVAGSPPVTLVGLRVKVDGVGAEGVVTVQPVSRTFAGVADPSLTSTVQSAGAVNPDRSILNRPSPSLVPMATPSTVIVRLGVAVPSILRRSPLSSARETETAA